MYPKRALFLLSNASPSLKSIHKCLRNLCTAVERFDFRNPNGYRTADSSPLESKYNTQTWGSSPVQSHHPDAGSFWHSHSGQAFDEFDAFCKQDNLKMALTSVESLERMGHVFDLPRLLRLAQLCGEEEAFQEAKAAVHPKISASVCLSDANHLNYYTDIVVEEFDGFCKIGKVKKALYTIDTLASMRHSVDLTRLLRLAKLCGEVEAAQEAKAVHAKISASVSHLDASSYHLLIEMYSLCGLVNEALTVFDNMPDKNLDSWYSIIRCFAKNGLGEDAIDMLTRFKSQGNKPDGQLFRGIFYACGVLGDVDEGLLHFESMSKDYGIIPSMEHYVSIVEMFALSGFLDEALEFVEKIPIEPNVDVWETLMNLSRVHGDLELGDRCTEIVQELEPTRLNKQSRDGFLPVKSSDVVRASLKKMSEIHAFHGIKTRMHEYKAGDTNLPENDELFALLRNLKKHMLEMGYVVDTRPALHDVDQESKEAALLGHSERIAFARAVLNSPPRTPFTVMKNLRVCVDCHNALKIMARIVGRAVVMRDAKRFHHLKDGACSCRDYW